MPSVYIFLFQEDCVYNSSPAYNLVFILIFTILLSEMAKLDEKIGFIGGGNMAFAIGSGLINRGIVKTGQVFVSGPNIENLQRWRDIGVATTDDNNEVLNKSDIIFICVKPHILAPCAEQLRNNHVRTIKDMEKLFVSVLAGVSLKDLEEVGICPYKLKSTFHKKYLFSNFPLLIG